MSSGGGERTHEKKKGRKFTFLHNVNISHHPPLEMTGEVQHFKKTFCSSVAVAHSTHFSGTDNSCKSQKTQSWSMCVYAKEV